MGEKDTLSLGFSPCPNDTFIFYALVHGLIDAPVSFQQPQLEDVEQLNHWAVAGKLDVTKLSFHALAHVLDDYVLLRTGSALGRGCGPLLVAKGAGQAQEWSFRRIAIPGKLTTAAMLLQMFLPYPCELVEMRFDHIMDAVKRGEVDGGVIIHESRFTYGTYGLKCIQDLGQWWEDTTSMPIPLGGIAAKRSLGAEKIKAVEKAIGDSVRFAFKQPGRCLPYIRQHSQELEEEVVQSHIGLYVNNFSENLGEEGARAIALFLEKGRTAGGLPACDKPVLI